MISGKISGEDHPLKTAGVTANNGLQFSSDRCNIFDREVLPQGKPETGNPAISVLCFFWENSVNIRSWGVSSRAPKPKIKPLLFLFGLYRSIRSATNPGVLRIFSSGRFQQIAKPCAVKIKKVALRKEYNLFTHYNYNTSQKMRGRQ